jgi:hypothetical protein
VSVEPIEGTSADLPYELQSKLYDQLAAISIGGAGLTVTLIGSVLAQAPGVKWLAVVEFGLAAFAAIVANVSLIQKLFERKASPRSNKWMTALCVLLIGMAVGSLSMSVYLGGKTARHADPAGLRK